MILARYLVKEVLLNTMAVTLVLVLVGITNQVVVYLARAASGILPVTLVLEVVGLNIPYLLSFMLPFGFFLGVLLAYGRLYADAEMTVMQACGFSIARLVWVTAVASLGVAILCAILTLWTTPASMQRLELSLAKMRTDVLANFIKPGQFQAWEDGQYVVYIAGVNEDERTVKEVFIAEQPQETTGDQTTDERLSVLTAGTGYLWLDPTSQAEYIVLEDGQRYLGTPGSAAYTVMGFKEYAIRVPAQNIKIRKMPRTQPTLSLFGSDDPDQLSELQWRFSLPLSILVLAVLSVPLSRVAPRKGKFSTIFPALIVILIYSNCLMLTRSWVEEGLLNPWVGLVWPHLVALTFAALLIAHQTHWFQRLRRRPH